VSSLILACTTSAAQMGGTAVSGLPLLALRLDAPAVIHSGETAQLTLHVTNPALTSLTTLSGIPPQEFVVKNPQGEEIWSSLATAACPNADSPWSMHRDDCTIINGFRVSAGHEWTFAPGEGKTLTGTWDGTTSRTDRVPPGDYLLTGVIEVGEGEISTDPVTITVLP
jgi:hypothetical protein